jgi:nucleotide-binding universal stress UspA family protein
MKILVPITNSKISKAGALYAANLASSLKADLFLLSVINASSTPNTLANWRKLEQQMVKNEKESIAGMIRQIKDETGTKVKISHKCVLGFPVEDMVDRFVRENCVDFVVMGTGGAQSLRKAIAGTNTASVIDHSTVPVLAVPKDATSQKIKKIVYATDMAHLDEEIKTVARFAKLFDAGIDILYVTGEGQKKRNRSELDSILIRMAQYPKIHINTIGENNIANGINSFVMKHKADLLAMFTHKLDFFEKVFGKSLTRKMALHSRIPLLAFNKTNS